MHVRARLWNATLVADYPRVDSVRIVSHATIRVPEAFDILQNRTDDRTSVIHYQPTSAFFALATCLLNGC